MRREMEVYDKRQMVRGPPSQRRPNDASVVDEDGPAVENFVQRRQRQHGREGAIVGGWLGRLVKLMVGENTFRQGVAPVVEITDDQRRQLARLLEEMVSQQVVDLPMAFLLRKTEVPIHQMKRALRRIHDHELSSRRLLLA